MFLGNTSNLNFAVNNLPNECSHGLTVTQNSLIIKFSGHYYIYCSIRFRQTDINSPTKSYASFLHRINSGEPERTGVLLKSVITGLKSSKDTTFMGGVFFLREHDIIQVVVTDSDSVDYKSESTFIGLFLLASRRTLMPG
ncbi:unnamed protein product [Lymnaea stagnalis]|uniref:THD domain-containing protein n=1 Tax=Lymnaea stagnalis TaxID=6523 RepID=A0AAV2I4D3_LYMST